MNGGDGWGNDNAVPLLRGAPPQVRERDHEDSHADDIDETSEESKVVLMSQMGHFRQILRGCRLVDVRFAPKAEVDPMLRTTGAGFLSGAATVPSS